jgi:hypothetical protein
VKSLGCFPDHGDPDGTNGRDLNGLLTTRPEMTTEMCTSTCAGRGFMYAGTQSSTQCFCGKSYGRFSPGGDCNDKCGGNAYETCGGSWSNLVYQVLPVASPPPPTLAPPPTSRVRIGPPRAAICTRQSGHRSRDLAL